MERVIVKILGAIDLLASFIFLMYVFGMTPFMPLILFAAGLLFVKGFFILSGDILSAIDLISSITLVISIFITLPVILMWAPAFLLLAKGFVSFV